MRHFLFGIEHETAFIAEDGSFADFSNTSFEAFDAIIKELPFDESDYPSLRIGPLGIKRKRWYIEEFDRYDETGTYLYSKPKGIEIRTVPSSTIRGAVEALTADFALMREVAARHGLRPVWTSFNPFRDRFVPDPPLNAWEIKEHGGNPEKETANIPMVTYGPDLSVSWEGASDQETIDLGRKLTYYSPYILPFSYASPYANGELWDGLSVRTFRRTGLRPAVMVFVSDEKSLVESTPSLTKPPRIEGEKGRVEFKAFDAQRDFGMYASLLALIKGLALDATLPGRATTPDRDAHRHSAQAGFADEAIAAEAGRALAAAHAALAGDDDAALLAPLERMLAERASPAHAMIEAYREAGSVGAALTKLTY